MQPSYSIVTHIPRFFTGKGVMAFFGVSALILLLFIQRVIPIMWALFNIAEVLLFFVLSSSLSIKWAKNTPVTFVKKLFRTSLFIRLSWVIFSYFFYIEMTGQPFEFDVADAKGYHGEGVWLAGLLKDNKWSVYTAYIGKNYADMGYPFYLGSLYYVIGEDILIPRLIKAILGSFSCLLIYKIARNNFGESTGRMAGIMSMLVPNLIYYAGLHVKETEMVFLVVCFIYQADKMIRSRKLEMTTLIWLGLLGSSLFFFRTVLAVCLIGSLGIATLFTSSRVTGLSRRFGLFIILGAAAFFIVTTPLAENIDTYLNESDKNLTSQMTNYANQAHGTSNKLAVYGSRSIFLPLIFIAPFPTLVYIYDQPNAMMLGGAYFTRNVYAFFVIVGLLALYKRKQLREHLLLITFVTSYIFVLASSGFAMSERFHLPLVPFLLVLAAYGMSQMNQKNKKYYVPYLVLVSLIIIGWNWFKLAGRS